MILSTLAIAGIASAVTAGVLVTSKVVYNYVSKKLNPVIAKVEADAAPVVAKVDAAVAKV
jgi:Na+-transporting methylmalonyl-CoA/oxaloacetate decarboxylase beta subunit